MNTVFCNQTTYSFVQTLEANCTHVLNELVVAGLRAPTLAALHRLTHVGGSLIIIGNPELRNLSGLSALEYIGGLTIAGNEVLSRLDGLASLRTVGSVAVQGNERLLDARGLCDAAIIGSVDIRVGTRDFTDLTFCNRTGFDSRTSLKQAVDEWLYDPVSAAAVYGAISDWDVRLVTDMEGLFSGASSFNENLASWDVSEVTVGAAGFQPAIPRDCV